jgi:hypothetical protein
VPEQQPPAGFEPPAWSDPTASPYPPATPSDPWAPGIPQQPGYGRPPPSGQPADGPPASGQPAYGPPAYGPPASGQPASGQPASCQPASCQPAWGKPSTPPYQQSPYQQPGYGPAGYPSHAYGQPRYGQPAHGQPYGQSSDPGYGGQPQGYPPTGWGASDQAAPAYGWPATPPQRRTGRIVGIIAAVVVVVLGGLAAIGATLRSPDNGNATNTASNTPVGPRIAIGDGTALLGAIVTPSSAGHAQTIPGTSHGVMTLDQLISLSFANDAAEKGRLTDRGFAAAAQREWINSNNVQIDIQLIQFKDSSGANEHVSNQVDAYDGDDKVTGSFAISGVPGGKGFEKSERDSYGNRSATLIAPAGNVAVLMFLFTPHDFDRATEISVMAKQVAALRA